MTAIIKLIEQEPSNVGETEEDRDESVGASFFLERVCGFAICSPVSVDCPLCLYKKPDHQNDHHYGLAQENVPSYNVHGTIIVFKGILTGYFGFTLSSAIIEPK